MRALLLALLLALVPAWAQAQSTVITRGPVPIGSRVVYEAPTNITTVQDAQSFEARLNDGSTPLTAATVASGLSCTTSTAGITCNWVLTQSNLDALNRVGLHTLTLKLFRSDVGESPASSPFSLTTPAAAPTGLRVTSP